MQWRIVLGLVIAHASLVAGASYLPVLLLPALAATVYLPLWPLASIGLPVFGGGESGGWQSPNVFGWTVLLLIWSAIWTVLVVGIAKAGKRLLNYAGKLDKR